MSVALIQLIIALAPLGEQVIAALVPLIQHLIDGGAPESFKDVATVIVQGIALDHPDWDEAQKKRYAVDAITQYAQDQGVPVDPTILAQVTGP